MCRAGRWADGACASERQRGQPKPGLASRPLLLTSPSATPGMPGDDRPTGRIELSPLPPTAYAHTLQLCNIIEPPSIRVIIMQIKRNS